MLWQIEIYPAEGQPDRDARRVAADAADLGIQQNLQVRAARGYLVQGTLDASQVQLLANELLADRVVERTIIAPVGDNAWHAPSDNGVSYRQVHVLLKPGVMDPVAQSTQQAIGDYKLSVDAVRTYRSYRFVNATDEVIRLVCSKILANDSIEQVVVGPLQMDRIQLGEPYEYRLITVPIRKLNDEQLMALSRQGQLYLTLVEMQTIQTHFQKLDRDPTDAELETVAQTWSEHCSHKTLAGRIEYRDAQGIRRFENMLKETIFAATQAIRKKQGDRDWCVSVFKDNAGIVRFDDEYNVVFKVETHNHPSALEPYGGANTGIGGVIRDPMGTGLGAKPVCNTDVFCFAPPDTPLEQLHPGVQHPRRVMKGVVSGVRDYGNRMGIPTVNGAIFFDPRYLGNPLVYCGNVGIIPRDKSFKEPQVNDYIVVMGGRTGRDGIHGATFSSAELTSESETLSGGAVQIGNAITEKMVLDVLMTARDRSLFHAVTDCGAGGLSSAVGEMGEEIGAEVWLDKAPVKYDGLSYTEIWISEAQERMVLAVSPEAWPEFESLCRSENVEATVIGRFVPTGRLQLKYHDAVVGDLSMEFLHEGRPPVVRQAVYEPPVEQPLSLDPASLVPDFSADLLGLLGCLNIASKEWVIRQYDHEVQGGSVIKPLIGPQQIGPSDAAVVRPRLDSRRGLVISCGMNPQFGDYDTYHMAASAIDEAIRNAVAVGADPRQIAILDNFCWGYTDRPETLGSLVRAAIACYDMAVALETPFISGKDSLNNEFSYLNEQGEKRTISIPPSLLISAMGQVESVETCVTMDLKQSGNRLFQVGITHEELGGSHWVKWCGAHGGRVPQVNPQRARQIFERLHEAIRSGLVRACHDLSEGGLAVALAEMAFAGGLGATVDLNATPHDLTTPSPATLLFSESNTRFVCEVSVDQVEKFKSLFVGLPVGEIGEVNASGKIEVRWGQQVVLSAGIEKLQAAWQAPLRWS